VRIFDVNKGAMDNFMSLVKDQGITKRIAPCATIEDALKGSDGAIIQTESKEFKELRPKDLKKWMRRPIIIDGRRTLDPHLMARSGIIYRGIGWKNL
jgi:UDP-glucose 6-dehydrogenase